MAVVSKGFVIDASAALAVLLNEPGSDLAGPHFAGNEMLVISYAEVVQRLWRQGRDLEIELRLPSCAGVSFVSPELKVARLAGDLERRTKPFGVSLADRFCLAHAMEQDMPMLTADHTFSLLGLPLNIKQLR